MRGTEAGTPVKHRRHDRGERPGKRAAAALAALGLACALGASGARSAWRTEPAGGPVRWSALRYDAEGWLGTVSAEVRLWPGALASLGAPAAPEGAGGGTIGDGDSWVARLVTRVDPALLPRKSSEIRAWFDPADGAVAGFTKLSLGPRPDRKVYRFARDGARRVRVQPGRGEESLLPRDWTRARTYFHAFEAETLGCRVVSDPAVLVFRISSAGSLDPADLEGWCVYSGKTLFSVEARIAGSRSVEADYRVRTDDGQTRRRGTVRTRVLRVLARPIAGEPEDEMRVAIHLEEITRIPVQVTTRVELLGALDVKLSEVQAPKAAAELWARASADRS